MRNVKEYADDCIEMLNIIGIEVGKITEIKVNNRLKTTFGQTHHCRETGENIVEINPLLLDERNDEMVLYDTMLHELLHTCKDCQNHGYTWKRYAARVNAEYNLNISTYGDLDELTVQPKFKYIVECPECGFAPKYYRKCGCVTNPDRYICGKCHSKGLVVKKVR